jgi:hypothetical protein
MQADFESYFKALAETARQGDDTEHTDRLALQRLLQQAADDVEPGARITHEPKRDGSGLGSPDFKISRGGRITGYVEVKTIDENLSKVLKSEQIKKYKQLSDNLILTDYLEFVLITKGEDDVRVRLAHSTDLSARRLALNPEQVAEVSRLLRRFFSATPAKTERGRDLAIKLATRAALLRDELARELIRQAKDHREGRLHGLFEVFKQQIFHELTTPEFADAFAQMLTYGLFLARLNAGEKEEVSLDNVRKFIPGSFSLIRELVRFLEEMNEPEYARTRWITGEVVSIVNGIDLAAIHNDLSFRARKAINRSVRAEDEEEHRLFERDPFIYFYEDFLKAYDPAMRKSRGVYYTPPPVVNFIVRAVDDVLKDSFGIRDGLADHNRVTVLDFACGTGTFLLEVFERIFENIGGADSGKAHGIVREHLTKNIFGFEYLIAPYTIAHLKLSQYLKDKDHPLERDERLQVFLTNTLEPIEPQANALMPALSAESQDAQAVKQKPILVIVGNPPYSGHSKNKGVWIKKLIDGHRTETEGGTDTFIPGYKHTIELLLTGKDAAGQDIWSEIPVPLGERNSKWLNDDYVKFIRFAQWKMDQVDEGIVGIITNHSWLDNPTFRAMRQSLMRSFDQIHVLDLHGNAKKKEQTPDGEKDENVFDIEQGVAISLFVKKPGIERGVWRGDLWGKRLEKYECLTSMTISESSCLTRANMSAPEYEISSVNSDSEYEQSPSLHSIFISDSVGIVTGNNAWSTTFSHNEMIERVHIALKNDGQVSPWGKQAIADVQLHNGDEHRILPFLYTPFDTRYTFYTGSSEGVHVRPRALTAELENGNNISLLFTRVTKDEPSALVTSALVGNKSSSRYDITYFAPFRLGAEENIDPQFRSALDNRYGHYHAAEEIFGYIYAILNSPIYLNRYAHFLRRAFPRIMLPANRTEFDDLATLGWDLVQAHLLRRKSHHKLATYSQRGSNEVDFVRYSPVEQAIHINGDSKTGRTQRFASVPQAVWDFHIGGYQVLDKYLTLLIHAYAKNGLTYVA